MRKCWFRSSVGLEQQPSKLWVLGSNPNGITLLKVPIILTFNNFPFLSTPAVKLSVIKKTLIPSKFGQPSKFFLFV